MRKSTLLTTAFVFIFAFAFAGASYAGNGCSSSAAKASCDTKANLTDAQKAACDAKTDGTSASAYTKDKAACSTDKGGAMGSVQKATATFATATFNVKGMTCSGCENMVTSQLSKVDGVNEVVEVSHKTGSAVLTFDPQKIKAEDLAKMVTDMGYKAEVVTANADMSNNMTDGKTKTM